MPSLRGLVAAGEALNPEVLRAFREATGLWIRDGYGQTETGQTTGPARGTRPDAGLDGPAAAGRAPVDRRRRAVPGSADRSDVLPRLPRRARPPTAAAPWRTGDRVTQDDDGYLYFEGRADDVIISRRLPDRPVRGRVGARLPPGGRGGRRGRGARTTSAARSCARSSCCATATSPRRARRASCRSTSRRQTAPYKYPRIVEFASDLPKTASGKVRRSLLRDGP